MEVLYAKGLNVVVQGGRERSSQGIEERSHGGELEYEHLLFQNPLALQIQDEIDYEIDSLGRERLVVAIGPHYLAATIEHSFFLIVGNAVLNIVLNVRPKISIFLVDEVGLASGIA
jgi:hypothetical protein